ncbi:unnamed protein product [Didymodactylos carnosus]|uniref:diacylglycerol kinase (ATP) n=1 Tax=Didymodactylos carnosus TaxID=1234261 RepID=A0A8S2H637_9BILA|nr:unnamed protein product [Didymodactylos carnosus]CAF3604673.1 unnamed protein product [Didymodactylos carnosus]
MPHQWLEGNLPLNAKCIYCDKACGSLLRLQDFKCLWCKVTIHQHCREYYFKTCTLGISRLSVLSPMCIQCIDPDGFVRARRTEGSPLLVFVNSKSGDNQGVKFLRKFKQLLNPAQVFDLMNGGPETGFRMFEECDCFRILVCGGDGSVGWVLRQLDKTNVHKNCRIGVLPLGTGNDLARVFGWGSVLDDENQLPKLLDAFEHATTKMLDRWSILIHEKPLTCKRRDSEENIFAVHDLISHHIGRILQSDKSSEVIFASSVVTSEINQLISRFKNSKEMSDNGYMKKCGQLKVKLDSFISTLKHSLKNFDNLTPTRIFHRRKQICHRANSLQRALKQVLDLTQTVNQSNRKFENYSSIPTKIELPFTRKKSKDELITLREILPAKIRDISEQRSTVHPGVRSSSCTILDSTLNESISSELNDYHQSTNIPPLASEEPSIVSSPSISVRSPTVPLLKNLEESDEICFLNNNQTPNNDDHSTTIENLSNQQISLNQNTNKNLLLAEQQFCIPSISISGNSSHSSNDDETSSDSSLSFCGKKLLNVNSSEIGSSYESLEDTSIQKKPLLTTHSTGYSMFENDSNGRRRGLSSFASNIRSRSRSPSKESGRGSAGSRSSSASKLFSYFSSSPSRSFIGQALLASSDLFGALITLPTYENIPM